MPNCPHCEHELTETEARAIFGSFAQSRRKIRKGGTNGGRPKPCTCDYNPDSMLDCPRHRVSALADPELAARDKA
jgi:hypothetical protein